MALLMRKTMTDRLQENASRMSRRLLGRRGRRHGGIAQLSAQRVTDEANRMALTTRRYVSQHPLTSAGVLAVIAALLGYLLGRLQR